MYSIYKKTDTLKVTKTTQIKDIGNLTFAIGFSKSTLNWGLEKRK